MGYIKRLDFIRIQYNEMGYGHCREGILKEMGKNHWVTISGLIANSTRDFGMIHRLVLRE